MRRAWKAIGGTGGAMLLLAVLQYVESYWEKDAAPRWLQIIAAIPFPVLGFIFAASILGLLLLGFRRLDRMDGRLAALEAETSDQKRLEAFQRMLRVNAAANWQMLRGGPLDVRVAALERAQTRDQSWVGGEEEVYPTADGRRWTRAAIDALPDDEKRKLFKQSPGISDWWGGKPLK